jgi:hypothetical protein
MRVVHRDRDWITFRAHAFRTSGAIVALAVVGLALTYHFEPAGSGSKANGVHLTPHQFGLLQTLLTTVLSIGVISLLFEYLLRRSWAEDLLRFLRLNVAVSKSGIQHVGEEPSVDWAAALGQAVEVRALVRDPSKWLQTNLSHLLLAAQRHSANILIGVPNPDGEHFEDIAACVGLSADQLRQSIDIATQSLEAQWAAHKPHLNEGSVFRLVPYDQIPLYELVAVDNSTFCFLSRPVSHGIGDYALVLEFLQDSPQYPATWLRESLRALEDLNELTIRDRNT